MKPRPWSHTSLDAFHNCPFAFYNTRILKKFADVPGTATLWGREVHTAFEHHQRDNVPLPPHLREHQAFMDRLRGLEGDLLVEQKVALTQRLVPCGQFDEGVWWRGVIDFAKICPKRALLVDYKTGKRKDNFEQLQLFALHTFYKYPTIDEVSAFYYWLQIKQPSFKVFRREEIPALWKPFVPKLKQYAEAFKTDTWQPRPSGLCHGWCAVTDCEHWKPKRPQR